MNESQIKLFSDTFAEFSSSEAFKALCDDVSNYGMSTPENHLSMEDHARKQIFKLGMYHVIDRIKLYSTAQDSFPDPYAQTALEPEDLDDNALSLLD